MIVPHFFACSSYWHQRLKPLLGQRVVNIYIYINVVLTWPPCFSLTERSEPIAGVPFRRDFADFREEWSPVSGKLTFVQRKRHVDHTCTKYCQKVFLGGWGGVGGLQIAPNWFLGEKHFQGSTHLQGNLTLLATNTPESWSYYAVCTLKKPSWNFKLEICPSRCQIAPF